jgi:hypothetical protein
MRRTLTCVIGRPCAVSMDRLIEVEFGFRPGPRASEDRAVGQRCSLCGADLLVGAVGEEVVPLKAGEVAACGFAGEALPGPYVGRPLDRV